MLKKVLLSCALVMCLHVPVAGAETVGFVDTRGHWAEKAITQLEQHNVVHSDESRRFRPDQPITRAELMSMLLAAKHITPVASHKSAFADVHSYQWYAPVMETAYQMGFIQGNTVNGRLFVKPNQSVTRQELISFYLQANAESGLIRHLSWVTALETIQPYKDHRLIPEWFQRQMAYALQRNLITPTKGKLEPTKVVTRADAAQLIWEHLMKPKLNISTQTRRESGARFSYVNQMDVQTTAYHEEGQGKLAYIGWPVRYGIVSVDPKVIPLGTHLYIEGYGYAVAADTGGAVKDKHIDVFLPSLQAAIAYGRQKHTRVYILD